MSDNVMSVGFMAPLITPLVKGSEELEILQDRLYEESTLQINYEGTIVFSAEDSDMYGLRFGKTLQYDDFLKEAADMGLAVDGDTKIWRSAQAEGVNHLL
jgi:hypothetical protein